VAERTQLRGRLARWDGRDVPAAADLPRSDLPLTRRCTQRQFSLRPDETTNAIVAYCLAEAAERCEVDLVAWLVMSNHYHAVVHDPHGRFPVFREHLHKMLAEALNVRWCRWENLWSAEETCVTYLPTPEDIFDKVVYVLANPVVDHLVERLGDWPGRSSLRHLGGAQTVHERPRSYFRATGGTMLDRVALRAVIPRASPRASPSLGGLRECARRLPSDSAPRARSVCVTDAACSAARPCAPHERVRFANDLRAAPQPPPRARLQ
jgi:putative transposase